MNNAEVILKKASNKTAWILLKNKSTAELVPLEVTVFEEQENGLYILFNGQSEFIHKDNIYQTEQDAKEKAADFNNLSKKVKNEHQGHKRRQHGRGRYNR